MRASLMTALTVVGFVVSIIGVWPALPVSSRSLITGGLLLFAILVVVIINRRRHDADSATLNRIRRLVMSPSPAKVDDCSAWVGTAVQSVAETFTELVHAKVSACVQIVCSGSDPNTLWLQDVARDKESQSRTLELAKAGVRQSLQASSTQYSVFAFQGGLDDAFYFSHDVSLDTKFQCPLLLTREHPNCEFWLVGPLVRWWKWPLYRSRLVVPIISGSDSSDRAILGFFCIDSTSGFVFSRKRDVELLKIVAAHLGPALEQIRASVAAKVQRAFESERAAGNTEVKVS